MSDSGKPRSWTGKLLAGSASLFAAAILLQLTLALIREIWWVIASIAVIVVALLVVRWWVRRRHSWD